MSGQRGFDVVGFGCVDNVLKAVEMDPREWVERRPVGQSGTASRTLALSCHETPILRTAPSSAKRFYYRVAAASSKA